MALITLMLRLGWGSFTKVVKSYLKEEGGQTSIEYILLLVVVAAIIFKFKTQLSGKIDGLLEQVFGQKLQELMKD